MLEIEGIDSYYRLIPWALLGTSALIALMIFWKIWKRTVSRKVRSIEDGSAMSMMDVDTLRKRGLISEEEYRRIRSTLASREVERTQKRQRQVKEQMLLSQVEKNPLAAYQLLDLDGPAAPEPPAPQSRPAASPNPASAPSPVEPRPRPAASAPPSMNMPRVVQARNEARRAQAGSTSPNAPQEASAKPRDLDLLLEKGAITPEEYQRLKKFFE